ncbi:MAG: hypothetical protein MZU97_18705 [Bacillus subtilis]|nr:hypothetical protein [Bacillus subtilis]
MARNKEIEVPASRSYGTAGAAVPMKRRQMTSARGCRSLKRSRRGSTSSVSGSMKPCPSSNTSSTTLLSQVCGR